MSGKIKIIREETVSDVLRHELLFPEVEKIENSQLLNKSFRIKSAEVLPSSFGGEFVVALIEYNHNVVSTSFGSKVVVEQIKKLKGLGKMGIIATLTQEKSKNNKIYQKLI